MAAYSSAATSSLFSRLSVPTLAASLPLIIWARDNICGLVRVQGPSMEPTLQQGDVVLVRKADAGVLPRLVRSIFVGDNDDSDRMDDPLIKKRQMAVVGGSHHNGLVEPNNFARLYDRPPMLQRGQVVVIKSVDTAFPEEWNIKRVWGTPGTWVQIENGRRTDPFASDEDDDNNNGTTRKKRKVYRRLQGVPPHTLYIGGDNEDCSRDSRNYGTVSQNLIVGVAEYVVWPPWRVRKIATQVSAKRSVPSG